MAKFEFASEDELFAKVAEELDSQVADARALEGKGQASPLRNYEAIEIVHSRIEVAVGGTFSKRKGGIDVRRDGSSEAWLGGASKQLIEPRPGEDLVAALRREIDSGA